MKLRQKMTMNAMFVVVFCFFYETKVEDNNERASSLSFIFSYIAEDNDEPPHSSSSFATIGKKKHKNLEEDDEPSSSLSSFATQEKKTLMLVFLGLQETMVSLSTCPRLLVFFPSFVEDND
jgi:hypothetical protein